MAQQKRLAKGSRFAHIDANNDGEISDEEISDAQALTELENKDKKEDQLRKMAWISMISMLVFTVALFTPFVSVERLTAMDNIISMFYIAQAGVVASFFGSSAYMSRST